MKIWMVVVFLLAAANIAAQNEIPKNIKYFDGLYLGMQYGSQNIFGGSWVNGMDVLAQKQFPVFEVTSGFRKQFLHNRFILGAELQFGFSDVNLRHEDLTAQLAITYKNDRQHGVGGMAGVTFGKRKRLLGLIYVNETTRVFNVNIVNGSARFKQRDEQGMLKYGLGVEVVAWRWFTVRATAGLLRVDFGSRPTNIDVEDGFDLMAGIVYRPWTSKT